jgi:hypothetical protein
MWGGAVPSSTLTLQGHEWSASHPCHFNPTPYWTGGSISPRADMNAMEKRKILFQLGLKPNFLAVNSATSNWWQKPASSPLEFHHRHASLYYSSLHPSGRQFVCFNETFITCLASLGLCRATVTDSDENPAVRRGHGDSADSDGNALADTVASEHGLCPQDGRCSHPHRGSMHIDCHLRTGTDICLDNEQNPCTPFIQIMLLHIRTVHLWANCLENVGSLEMSQPYRLPHALTPIHLLFYYLWHTISQYNKCNVCHFIVKSQKQSHSITTEPGDRSNKLQNSSCVIWSTFMEICTSKIVITFINLLSRTSQVRSICVLWEHNYEVLSRAIMCSSGLTE